MLQSESHKAEQLFYQAVNRYGQESARLHFDGKDLEIVEQTLQATPVVIALEDRNGSNELYDESLLY